mgnify:CR=1 FL=1
MGCIDGYVNKTEIMVTGSNASFTSTMMDLGGGANEDTNIQTLTFNDTAVSIIEYSSTDLVGANVATAGLTLVSSAGISDGAGINTDITVTGGNRR